MGLNRLCEKIIIYTNGNHHLQLYQDQAISSCLGQSDSAREGQRQRQGMIKRLFGYWQQAACLWYCIITELPICNNNVYLACSSLYSSLWCWMWFITNTRHQTLVSPSKEWEMNLITEPTKGFALMHRFLSDLEFTSTNGDSWKTEFLCLCIRD